MRKLWLLMCFLLFLIIVGCSSEPQPERLSNMNFEDVKEKVSVGLSKNKMEELFGKPSDMAKENSIEGLSDNPETWRYDFPNNGYTINPKAPDHIDLEGLQSGDMRLQLRIEWSSGLSFNRKVGNYAIFYKKDGLVYLYTPEGKYYVYNSEDDKFIEVKEQK